MNQFNNPIFQDETKAREWLEARIWPDGPVCPHCGAFEDTTRMEGEAHRAGLYQCNACRKQFTVTVGTVFERSKIPLTKWLLATFLLVASKKGISAHQMHRMLGVSYKSTWFMMHRLREALRPLHPTEPMGGEGKIVEADETYIGGKEKNKHKHKRHNDGTGAVGKEIAFALVERGGSVRSFHVGEVNAYTLRPILVSQISRQSSLMTDSAGQYKHMGEEFARHEAVNHGIDEYVRGDCHTNTVEGYFSILKRGITGTYHHVSRAHLKRYLGEFDFRYNHRAALDIDDEQRTVAAIKGIKGKRLTYRRTNSEAYAED